MISCHNLTKRFGKFVAVHDVSFEIAGGICALLGPNGAGKSTLVKLMTGLLEPDTGTVRLAGMDPREKPLEVRRSIGVVPEDLGLFDSLSVEEHLELSGAVYGLRAHETKARIGPLLRILSLEKGRGTFLKECSHGMRKKTALAMALIHNPRVLFLDEPFEGIDPVSSRTIRDLLSTAAARGITIFLTSHTLPIVDQLATEIMMIRSGRIVWNSANQTTGASLEELYFELVEAVPVEELAWLRPSPS
jgi:ABC-2 type transport system ATP-binding protein